MKQIIKYLQFKQWILSIVKLRCSNISDIGAFESELGHWEMIQDIDKDKSKSTFRLRYWRNDEKCDNQVTIIKDELTDLVKFMKQFY